MAHHDHYDRVVIELDREVQFERKSGYGAHERVLELAALPVQEGPLALSPRVAQSGRVRRVAFESIPGGMRIFAAGSSPNLQVFHLANPPRIVLDFADPESARLSAAEPERLDSSAGTAEAPFPAEAQILDVGPGEVRALESGVVVAAVVDRTSHAQAWAGGLSLRSAGALLFSSLGLFAAWRCFAASRELRSALVPQIKRVRPEDLLSPAERLELAERRP